MLIPLDRKVIEVSISAKIHAYDGSRVQLTITETDLTGATSERSVVIDCDEWEFTVASLDNIDTSFIIGLVDRIILTSQNENRLND